MPRTGEEDGDRGDGQDDVAALEPGLQHGVRCAGPRDQAASQARLTPMAARSGLIQVDKASTTAAKPNAGSSHVAGAQPGTSRPARATAGSATARIATDRSSTRRSTGYGVTTSGCNAGSMRGS